MTVTVRKTVLAFVAGLLLWFGKTAPSAAADQDALLQQMTTLNKGAIAAYSAGDFDKSKSQLLQAVALGKKDPELQTHPLMARTFVHLGVVYIDGLEDHAGGVKYFVKALKIRPDIEISQALATKTVKSAFEEAKADDGSAGGGETATAATKPGAAKTPAAAAEVAEDEEKPAAKMTAAEKRKAALEEKKQAAEDKKQAAEEKKQAALDEKKQAAEDKKQAAEEKKHAAEEAKKVAAEEKKAGAEKEKMLKELAQVQGNEAKERAAKEKVQNEKAEKEKALAETKAALDQLQKDVKEKEKVAAAEKDKAAKELAALKDSEAKERAAKEKLQTEKAEKEKLLAAANASIAQLQKEKADRDKSLADGAAREKKEREAKEKLEKEKQLAEAREKERKGNEEKERVNREKLAAGPDLPSHFASQIYCAIPDEAQAGTDLFVHCAAQAALKGKEIAFYYRASGSTHYNSLALEPSKKGWHAAMVPGDHVSGKLLQYYVEVRDGRGTVAAADGKPNSPNILTLKPAGSAANRTTVSKSP